MKITIEIDVEHLFDRETKSHSFVATYGWTTGGRAVEPKRVKRGYGATLDEAVANVLTKVAALFAANKVPS